MRSWLVSVVGLAFSLAVFACKHPNASQSDAAASANALADASRPEAGVRADLAGLDGPALYGTLCAICHAADASGYKADNAPSLVNRTYLESATDEQIRRSIRDGRPGTSMAAYGLGHGGPLDDASINKLVAWFRSQGPAEGATIIPPRGHGDATRGAPLYATNCEKCHGTAKVRQSAVQLANTRFLEGASDSFIGYAITKGRPGTAMDGWQGKLTEPQIDDIVAFVRAFDKPPPVETLPPPTGKEPIVINPRGAAPNFKPRSSPCIPNQPCTPDERFVPADQVKEALDQKRKVVIIDARPASEWMRVHIPGAVSIPYHDLKRLDEVPNDGTWILAYCACPHHLSGDVVDALRKRGVKHAAILDEGILEWHRRGYPVVAAPGVEPPPKENHPQTVIPQQPLPIPQTPKP